MRVVVCMGAICAANPSVEVPIVMPKLRTIIHLKLNVFHERNILVLADIMLPELLVLVHHGIHQACVDPLPFRVILGDGNAPSAAHRIGDCNALETRGRVLCFALLEGMEVP